MYFRLAPTCASLDLNTQLTRSCPTARKNNMELIKKCWWIYNNFQL